MTTTEHARTAALRRIAAVADQLVGDHEQEFLAANTADGAAERWREWRDAECDRRRRTIARWLEPVPPLFLDADLARLDDQQHPDELSAWLSGPARNLILAGPVGTGKSYAAWAIAHHAAACGLVPMVRSVPRLLLDMRPDGDPGTFDRACFAELLVLDDLGAARPTDWSLERIYSIAEHRTNYRLRTVVTTNCTFDQLAALWGAPTMDRLRDGATIVELTGRSRRGPA